MKIRNGFVSNSSSSSFVVAFPRKPSSAEEVKTLLFGKQEILGHYDAITTQQVAEIVFNDIQSSDHLTAAEIQEELSHGIPYPSYETNLESPKFPTVFYSRSPFNWDQYFRDIDEWAKKAADDFVTRNPNAIFYRFSYADEDGGIWATMEHGGIFDTLPYIQMSHH